MSRCFGIRGGDCCEVLVGYREGVCELVFFGIFKWGKEDIYLYLFVS